MSHASFLFVCPDCGWCYEPEEWPVMADATRSVPGHEYPPDSGKHCPGVGKVPHCPECGFAPEVTDDAVSWADCWDDVYVPTSPRGAETIWGRVPLGTEAGIAHAPVTESVTESQR